MKGEKRKIKIKKILPEDLGVEECTKYREQIASDNPEELEKERKRVLFKISIYGKGVLGKDAVSQFKPMIENMSVADCKHLNDTLDKKGVVGLVAMIKKHEREVSEEKKKKEAESV